MRRRLKQPTTCSHISAELEHCYHIAAQRQPCVTTRRRWRATTTAGRVGGRLRWTRHSRLRMPVNGCSTSKRNKLVHTYKEPTRRCACQHSITAKKFKISAVAALHVVCQSMQRGADPATVRHPQGSLTFFGCLFTLWHSKAAGGKAGQVSEWSSRMCL